MEASLSDKVWRLSPLQLLCGLVYKPRIVV
jgi:hypothetical protein